jgi:MinD superfamily P-loop ATPase
MISKKPLKIAVASGKGGTGKTLLATNLAAYLSRTQKTLLVDLDVEEPNDFIFIKGTTESLSHYYKMIPAWDETKCTLCSICSSSCKYHAVVQLGNFIAVFGELCHSCYACSELCPVNALPMQPHKTGDVKTLSSGNLVLIEGRLEIGEEQAVPLIRHIYGLVDKNYKNFCIQILDSPPGTSCPVVAATRDADFVIIVTEPTPFGLNDLKLAVETIEKLGKPMGVVINRYGIGNNDVEKYCEQVQLPVLTRIPFKREIATYYSRGEMVFDVVKEVEISLQEIMAHIEKNW